MTLSIRNLCWAHHARQLEADLYYLKEEPAFIANGVPCLWDLEGDWISTPTVITPGASQNLLNIWVTALLLADHLDNCNQLDDEPVVFVFVWLI